jgi:hypothetical protein
MKKTIFILLSLFLVLNVFGQEMMSGLSYTSRWAAPSAGIFLMRRPVK